MPKFTGTVRRSDLEGGMWLLATDDGDQYQLAGATTELRDGARVEVSGKVERASFGIGMAGAHLTIKRVRAL